MEFVTTRDELRTIYKTPRPTDGSIRKELKGLDGHCRSFIGKSPFVLIGSSDGAGNADVTPKGDRPGFAAVLDDRTIAIPDRPGNNRLDTLENILLNPSVGLLFLIPGMNETLRVNGDARITVDAGLRERFAIDGKAPQSVVVVSVKSRLHALRQGLHALRSVEAGDLVRPRDAADAGPDHARPAGAGRHCGRYRPLSWTRITSKTLW